MFSSRLTALVTLALIAFQATAAPVPRPDQSGSLVDASKVFNNAGGKVIDAANSNIGDVVGKFDSRDDSSTGDVSTDDLWNKVLAANGKPAVFGRGSEVTEVHDILNDRRDADVVSDIRLGAKSIASAALSASVSASLEDRDLEASEPGSEIDAVNDRRDVEDVSSEIGSAVSYFAPSLSVVSSLLSRRGLLSDMDSVVSGLMDRDTTDIDDLTSELQNSKREANLLNSLSPSGALASETVDDRDKGPLNSIRDEAIRLPDEKTIEERRGELGEVEKAANSITHADPVGGAFELVSSTTGKL